MTTVQQLIDLLQTLPQDAIVEVRGECGDIQNLDLAVTPLYVKDFRNNQFVKEDDADFGKVFVLIEGF
jgi:hypothetical protein